MLRAAPEKLPTIVLNTALTVVNIQLRDGAVKDVAVTPSPRSE